jgi:hypothetical protein
MRLCWENIDWDEKEIYVPTEVAKKARAEAGNSRYIPTNENIDCVAFRGFPAIK